MRWLLWIAAFIMLFVPSVILIKWPEHHNPLTAFLLSVGVAALSGVAGGSKSRKEILQTADEGWLRQAESACDKLLNILYSVKRFQKRTSASCGNLCVDFPQLHDKKNEPVRAALQRQCDETSAKLTDMVCQVESAYADWVRFINHTCKDNECGVIHGTLEGLRATLEEQLDGMEVHRCEKEQLNSD